MVFLDDDTYDVGVFSPGGPMKTDAYETFALQPSKNLKAAELSNYPHIFLFYNTQRFKSLSSP